MIQSLVEHMLLYGAQKGGIELLGQAPCTAQIVVAAVCTCTAQRTDSDDVSRLHNIIPQKAYAAVTSTGEIGL